MPKRVAIIVPTYKEAANLPLLVPRIAAVAERENWFIELLVMDDDSRDGSVEAVNALKIPWARVVVRTKDRGLSASVLDGFQRAAANPAGCDYLVCMDADLSHPPEKIPEMLAALDDGADFVLGSRYVAGGSTDDDWGLFRWLNSQVATALARPLTYVKDPMSGFFAMTRKQFESGRDFNPVGYKIALELLVKCNCVKAVEVPIHFADRQLGESKLSLKEQLKYLQHIRRLLSYKFGTKNHLAQFLFVGTLGAVVNLVVLTVALHFGARKSFAVLLGIAVSFLWNFGLNRQLTFAYARDTSILRQLGGFTLATTVGAIVTFALTYHLSEPDGPIDSVQIAAVIGIVVGALFNFVANRYFVFRLKHYVPRKK